MKHSIKSNIYFNLKVSSNGVNVSKVSVGVCNDQKEDQFNESCFDLSRYNYTQSKKAQVGQNVELECYIRNKGRNSVIWSFESDTLSTNDRIVKLDSNYQLNTDSETKFNLIINNVDISQTGSYKCQVTARSSLNLYYDLTVVGACSV